MVTVVVTSRSPRSERRLDGRAIVLGDLRPGRGAFARLAGLAFRALEIIDRALRDEAAFATGSCRARRLAAPVHGGAAAVSAGRRLQLGDLRRRLGAAGSTGAVLAGVIRRAALRAAGARCRWSADPAACRLGSSRRLRLRRRRLRRQRATNRCTGSSVPVGSSELRKLRTSRLPLGIDDRRRRRRPPASRRSERHDQERQARGALLVVLEIVVFVFVSLPARSRP